MIRVETNIFDKRKHFDDKGYSHSEEEIFYDDRNEYYRYKYILSALIEESDGELFSDYPTLTLKETTDESDMRIEADMRIESDVRIEADIRTDAMENSTSGSGCTGNEEFSVTFFGGYAKVWDGRESYFLTSDEYLRIVNLAKKYLNRHKEKLILLGGCFNPVTKAHYLMAKEMADKVADSFVVFVPTCDYYIRSYKEYTDIDILSEEARYEMLTECCLTDRNILVEDCEILEKRKVTRTFRTLHNLKKRYNAPKVCFSVGSGDLKYMTLWWNIDKMLAEYGCVVVERNVKDIDAEILSFAEFKGVEDNFLTVSYENIYEYQSSTLVRAAMRNGEDVSEYIPERAYACMERGDYDGVLMELYREAKNGQKE